MELWTHVKSTEKCKPRRHCVSESDGSNLLDSTRIELWRTTSFSESLSFRADSNLFSNAQSITRLVSRSEYHNSLKFELKQGMTLNLLLMLFVLSFGEIFPAAVNLAIIIIFHKEIDLHFAVLKEQDNGTYNFKNFNSNLTLNESSNMYHNVTFNHSNNVFDVWSIWLMLFIGAAMVGAFLLSISIDRIGRKKVCLLNSLFCMLCSFFSFFSIFQKSIIAFIFAVFFSGVNSGIGRGAGLLYMIEIVSYNLRGSVGSLQQIATSFPFLLVTIIKYLLIDESNLQYLFLLPMLNALSILFLLPWLPDSPRHIFLTTHNFELSFQGLKFLRKKDEVYVDIEEMETETNILEIPKFQVQKESKLIAGKDKDASIHQSDPTPMLKDKDVRIHRNDPTPKLKDEDLNLPGKDYSNHDKLTTQKNIQFVSNNKGAQQREDLYTNNDKDGDIYHDLLNLRKSKHNKVTENNDRQYLKNDVLNAGDYDASDTCERNIACGDVIEIKVLGHNYEGNIGNCLSDLVEVDESFKVEGKQETSKFGFFDFARSVDLRKPIFIAVILKAILHFSSAYFLLIEVGLLIINIEEGVINQRNFFLLSTSVYFLSSLLPLLLLRLRRRGLLINSLAGQLVVFGILVATFNLIKKHKWVVYISITGFLINIVIYTVSTGWLSSLMCLEMFRQNSRAKVSLIPVLSSYLFALLLLMAVHFLQPTLGPYILLVNVFGCLLLLMLGFGFVPETSMKTFEEISEPFSPASQIQVQQLVL